MGRSIETVALAVACSHCGGANLAVDDTGGDEAMTHCLDCGENLGAWAEVKEQARAAMFDAMRDDFAHLRPLAAANAPRIPAHAAAQHAH